MSASRRASNDTTEDRTVNKLQFFRAISHSLGAYTDSFRVTSDVSDDDNTAQMTKTLHSSRTHNRTWRRHPARQVFKCKHSLAPAYLSEQLQQVAQLESRQRLRSSTSSAFVVPATRRSTLGDRSFSAAGTRAWNSLPPTVTAATTLSSFRRYLKSHLFTKSFPSWR